MQIECPRCNNPVTVRDRDAGTTYRCGMCGRSFVVPADIARKGRPHQLSTFPVASLVLLHYITAGMFSVIYLNLLHDKMPQLRRSDPSATVAVGLSFVPGLNLIWFFFTYYRLCVRINEQRRFNGLPETAPTTLSAAVALLTLGGALAYVFPAPGLVVLGVLVLIVMPIFAGMVQNSINGLVEGPAVPAVSI
ncbi:MAG: hypothetical protein KAV82_02740 [Phycisphaerae bacterium]|nr:hypothetical protein [Phycisphaerae bacterium]